MSRLTSEGFRLGLVSDPISEDHEQFKGRLCIPNIIATPDGEERVVGLKFRNLVEQGERAPKFLSPKGQETRLYNLRALSAAYDTIVVAEGESDTWSISQAGLHCIGVPGVNNWGKSDSYRRRIFSGFARVILCRDADDAGNTLVQAMSEVDGLEVRMPPDGYKDFSEALVGLGEDAVKSHILGNAEGPEQLAVATAEDDDEDDFELSEEEEYELEHGYGPPPF